MHTPKKLTALVLAGALMATSAVAVPQEAQAKTFSDVASNHWAYAIIDQVSNDGLMQGMGNGIFSPNSKLTRAEYTTVLYNMTADKTIPYTNMVFLDTNGKWYADTARWGYATGVIGTAGDRLFGGDMAVSREYMAIMTYNYLNKFSSGLKAGTPSVPFSDISSVSSDARQAVNTLAYNGLLAGKGNNCFDPSATLTRAETATMIARIQEYMEKHNGSTPDNEEEQKPPTEDNNNGYTEYVPPWGNNPDDANSSVDPTTPSEPTNPSEPENPPTEDPTTFDLHELVQKPWLSFTQAERTFLYEQAELALSDNPTNYQLSSEQQTMIDSINAERREAGVAEVKISPALCRMAEIRAQEMVEMIVYDRNGNYFLNSSEAHSRPDNSKTTTVLPEIGLADFVKKDYGGNATSMLIYTGENMAGWNQSYSADHAQESLAASSGHYAQMIKESHEYVGVAVAQLDGIWIWYQEFGTIAV